MAGISHGFVDGAALATRITAPLATSALQFEEPSGGRPCLSTVLVQG